jgi:hypothetical protein
MTEHISFVQMIGATRWLGTYTVRYDAEGQPMAGTLIEWERLP